LYFYGVENEFLHKVNLDALQKETGLSLQGIADLAEVSVQMVYRWAWDKAKQGNRPSFNALVKLLEKGASTSALFGVECKNRQAPAEMSANKDFQEGVAKAFEDIKARGIIREVIDRAIAEMKAAGKI
jgi:hypothetical protein